MKETVPSDQILNFKFEKINRFSKDLLIGPGLKNVKKKKYDKSLIFKLLFKMAVEQEFASLASLAELAVT